MKPFTKLTVALALGIISLPGVSLAQTQSVEQLQTEIAALTAQLTQLEDQLAAQGSSSAWCYTFDSNLSIGMTGIDVTSLQTVLQKDGEPVQITGTFDNQTAAAIIKFQERYSTQVLLPYHLGNGTGYVGTTTRKELNLLFGCDNNQTIAPSVVGPVSATSTPTTPSVASTTATTSNAIATTSGPTLIVVYPNASTTWAVGTTQTIVWKSQSPTANIVIELASIDYGVPVKTIAELPGTTSSYSWTIPSTLGPGQYILDVISSALGGAVSEPFTLTGGVDTGACQGSGCPL